MCVAPYMKAVNTDSTPLFRVDALNELPPWQLFKYVSKPNVALNSLGQSDTEIAVLRSVRGNRHNCEDDAWME